MLCRTSARPCRAITWFSSAGTRWRAARSAWRTCWPSPPGRWPSAWPRSGAGARRAPPPEVLPGMMVDMRLTSRSAPGPEPEPSAGDDLDTGVTGLLRYRRLVIRVLLVLFLLLPVVALLKSPADRPGCLPDTGAGRVRAGRGAVRRRPHGLDYPAGRRLRGGWAHYAGRPTDRARPGELYRNRGGDQRRDRSRLRQ